jgi:class 3 adenylate cyclase/CHASE2 domain-containing sensor protein
MAARKQWGIGLAAAFVAAVAMYFGTLAPLERQTFDWRAATFDRASPGPSDKIALAAIDDRAIEQIGRWPWSREKLGAIIDELARVGAKVVALDILLDDEQIDGPAVAGPGADEQLAEAIRRHGNVVVPTNFRFAAEDGSESARAERIRGFLAEHPELVAEWRKPGVLRDAAERLARATLTTNAEEDAVFRLRERFERSLRRAVALSMLTGSSSFGDAAGLRFDGIDARSASTPVLPLASVAAMTANVTFNVYDGDSGVRRLPIAVRTDDRWWPSLGFAAALRFYDRRADSTTITERGLRLNLSPEVSRELITHSDTVGGTQRPGLTLVSWPRGRPSTTDRSRLDAGWQWQFFDSERARHAEVSCGAIYQLSELREKVEANSQLAKTRINQLYGPGARVQTISAEDRTELLASLDRNADKAAMLILQKAADEAKVWIDFQLDGTELAKLPKDDQDLVANFRAAERGLPELVRSLATQRASIASLEATLRERLGGRIVFVGFTFTGANADFVATSIDPKTPGVHLHMAVANSILQDFNRVYGPLWLDLLAAALLGILGTLVATRMGVVGAPLATVGIVAGWAVFAGAVLFDQQRLIVSVAGPGAAALGSSLAVLLHRLFVEQRTRRKTEERFKSYVSPKVVDILVNNPDLDSMQPQRRELSILFTDIAGFTTIAERLGSQKTAEVLRLYLGPMTETLQSFEGTLDKYIGDAIVAFWGAPIETERHAELSCRAALAMLTKLDELNASGAFGEGLTLGMRVGVATGEVMVGDFGNPPRNSSYTVLGDTANLASRLEGANKAFNSRFLTTGITRAAVLASAPADVAGWLWRPIGRINVKGKNEAVEMWELIGTLRPKGDRTEEHVRACARLVDAYVAGDVDAAATALEDLESAFGPDAFTHLYREGLQLIRDGHAAPGTLILTEK